MPSPLHTSSLTTGSNAKHSSHGPSTEPWRFTVFTGEARHKLREVFMRAYRMVTSSTFDEAVMALFGSTCPAKQSESTCVEETDAMKKMPE